MIPFVRAETKNCKEYIEKECKRQIHVIYPYAILGSPMWEYSETHPIGWCVGYSDTVMLPPMGRIIDGLLESQGMNRFRLYSSEYFRQITNSQIYSMEGKIYEPGFFKLSFSSNPFTNYQMKTVLTNQEGKYAAYHILEGPKEVLEIPENTYCFYLSDAVSNSPFLSFGISKITLLAFFADIPERIYVKVEPAQEEDENLISESRVRRM